MQNGVLHQHANSGPYNMAHIFTFLDRLVTAEDQMDADQMKYISIWDNVSFHWSAEMQNWFYKRPQFSLQDLPPPPPPPFFGMTMDGLWSPALCQDIHYSSHGGGLWPDWFRVCARMDSPLNNILPTLSCERGCRRSAMARCSEEIMLSFFMLSFSLHKYFCYLCYIMHLKYVMIFSAICNLWKCMDVLTDFTMWREIHIFINVQCWSYVLCLVNHVLYSNTISEKIKPRLIYH